MINNLVNKFLDLCNGNLVLLIVLLSIIPLLELRIAIPFALSTSLNINPFSVFSVAVSSTLIAIPLVFLLLKPLIKILNKIKFLNKLSTSIENYFSTKANDLKKSSYKTTDKASIEKHLTQNKCKKFLIENRIFFYLFIFVALPFPLTGYYTGCAIATFLNLNFFKSVISIFAGNIVAGLIITFFSSIFDNSALYILIIFLVLILLAIFFKLFKKLIFKKG